MCHADVSPISFHVVQPPKVRDDVGRGIFPRLATKHTCRRFERVQEWAREHNVAPHAPHLEASVQHLQSTLYDLEAASSPLDL